MLFMSTFSCEVEEESISQDEKLTITEELTAENVPQSPESTSNYENLYSPKNGRNNNELTNSTNKQQRPCRSRPTVRRIMIYTSFFSVLLMLFH